MEDDFLWTAGLALMEMRLVIEGALALYNADLSHLYARALDEANGEEALALDTLECALQSMQEHVLNLQRARIQASWRLPPIGPEHIKKENRSSE